MIRKLPLLALAASLVLMCSERSARANVRLPAIFADHMVIQQQQPIYVWGWADPDEPITVTLAGQRAETNARENGKWQLELGQLDAGQSPGPHQLVVSGRITVTVKDILVGEVWVCSGQSNMEWPVHQSANPDQEIRDAVNSNIRLFTVAKNLTEHPAEDCRGTWSVCSPRSVAGFSAVGYFFGRHMHKELGVPIGLINSSWGGTQCEAWTPREGLKSDEDFRPILERFAQFQPNTPHQASVLYNAMIHPLIPFGIRGAIWYQGESNVGRAQQYRKLFPTMISEWRKHWNQGEFPFYFVQLAPFRYGRSNPSECAELWEAQLKTLSLPNTGMAVTVDIGNVEDIHPKNKQDVGKRLALWALAKTYGREIVYSGPLFESMSIEDGKIRIHFRHSASGLASRDGEPLSHFTIAGVDEKFVPASATIEGDSVLVHSDAVSDPVAVRFAWRDDAQPNLINGEDLPASPFRTDDFRMVTDGKK